MKKNESQQLNLNSKISVSDIMKENTTEVIKKIESVTPTLVQNYSDLYTAYLEMFDDLFGICYLAEKKFFDKLNTDPNILMAIKKNSDSLKSNSMKGIELTRAWFEAYIKLRVLAIKSFDNYAHNIIQTYSEILPTTSSKDYSKPMEIS